MIDESCRADGPEEILSAWIIHLSPPSPAVSNHFKSSKILIDRCFLFVCLLFFFKAFRIKWQRDGSVDFYCIFFLLIVFCKHVENKCELKSVKRPVQVHLEIKLYI